MASIAAKKTDKHEPSLKERSTSNAELRQRLAKSGTGSAVRGEAPGNKRKKFGRRSPGLFGGVLSGERGPMGFLLLFGGVAVVVLRLMNHSKAKVSCPQLARLLATTAPPPTIAADCETPAAWLQRADDTPQLKGLPGWDQHDAEMLWGTYRPSVYFGFKTRTAPAAVNAGMLWHGGDAPGRWPIRHDTRMDNGVGPYNWLEHDGRSYGRQVIVDAETGLQITTSMAKPRAMESCSSSFGGEGSSGVCDAANGVEFASRVEVLPLEGKESSAPSEVSIYVYLSIDCDGVLPSEQCLRAAGAPLSGLSVAPGDDHSSRLLIGGATRDVGQFWLEIVPRISESAKQMKAAVSYVGLADVMAADAEQLLDGLIKESRRSNRNLGNSGGSGGSNTTPFRLPDAVQEGSNLVMVKLTAAPPFAVDLFIRSGDSSASAQEMELEACDATGEAGANCQEDGAAAADSAAVVLPPPPPPLPESALSGWLERGAASYSARFESVFKLRQKNFGDADMAAASAAFSSLLGGMGYFHGASKVKGVASNADANENGGGGGESFPASLFTAVPSRPVFPRGFLWDEGFHQLLVSAWDPRISVDVLGHWLGLLHVHTPSNEAAEAYMSSLAAAGGAAAAEAGESGPKSSSGGSSRNVTRVPSCPGAWIPREQVLGETARRRVPAQYLEQDVTVANPPTLLLLAERLLDAADARRHRKKRSKVDAKGAAGKPGAGAAERDLADAGKKRKKAKRKSEPELESDGADERSSNAAAAAAVEELGSVTAPGELTESEAALVMAFLERAGPAMDSWVRWMLHTQRPPGQALPTSRSQRKRRRKPSRKHAAVGGRSTPPVGAFQWRGRDPNEKKINPMTLPSGLDDFPRASRPSAEEHHVDLLCWMVLACRAMGRLQAALKPLPKSRGKAARDAASASAGAGAEEGGGGGKIKVPLPRKASSSSRGRSSDGKGAATAGADLSRFAPQSWLDVPYAAIAQELASAVDRLHWDEESGNYFDVGRHVANAYVIEEVVVRCASVAPGDDGNGVTSGGSGGGGVGSTVDVGAAEDALMDGSFRCPPAWPRLLYPLGDGRGGLMKRERLSGGGAEKVQFVRSYGYVSLFPLLMRVMHPRSLRLRTVLQNLVDPEGLWSPYGLRSLSRSDALYQRENAPGDEPYWRGYIWINVNYLALRALKHYSELGGPSKELAADAYVRLRKNVMEAVLGEYHRTGYFWEQYDDSTGRGRRGHPFTGWTALIVLIMGEIY